jgi:simple sugar transport system permease protein
MAEHDFEFICRNGIQAAAPLMLAGIGETVAQRAGVINIGIEGMMLAGALGGFLGAMHGGSAEGILLAAAAGMVLAAIFAIATIWMRADQIVSGCALNLLAAGAALTIWEMYRAAVLEINPDVVLPGSAGFSPIQLGIGTTIFNQFILTYVIIALALAVWAALKYTRGGLIIRALGDAPDACAAAGIRVRLWRTGCVIFAGALAGIAGSYLTIMRTHVFTEHCVGGRGYLVLALVIFGRWHIAGLAAGCLLFGVVDTLQEYGKGVDALKWIPKNAFDVLPYLATLAALALLSRRAGGPMSLGKPYPERV